MDNFQTTCHLKPEILDKSKETRDFRQIKLPEISDDKSQETRAFWRQTVFDNNYPKMYWISSNSTKVMKIYSVQCIKYEISTDSKLFTLVYIIYNTVYECY